MEAMIEPPSSDEKSGNLSASDEKRPGYRQKCSLGTYGSPSHHH